MSLIELPPEILLHISSYTHDPHNLHTNIFQFRAVCKTFFSITETPTFWNSLIWNQFSCGLELHIWLHDLELRTRTHNTSSVNDDDDHSDDFVSVTNNWIDQLVENPQNMVLQFLVRLAIGGDNLSHFGSVRVGSCIRYLFGKLFEPLINLIEKIRNSQHEELTVKKIVEPSDVFNMEIAEFLANNEYLSMSSLVENWNEIDYYNSLIPKQYIVWIVQYLSDIKLKYADSETNGAVWACEFLKNTLGLQVTEMDFINHSKAKNFEREDFIPQFSTIFSLQFLAVWIGNVDLVKWCIEHRSNDGRNRIDTLFRTGILEEKQPNNSTVSCYGLCCKRDSAGLTILHYAIRGKQVEIVKLLIEKYKANPFIVSWISPALLAYRMHSLIKEDESIKTIYNLLKEIYKENLEIHIENKYSNIFEKPDMKIFDLDETEQDDLEKLQIDKSFDPNRGYALRPLKQNFSIEDAKAEEHYSRNDENKVRYISDEDENEEYIDIETISSLSKKLNTAECSSEDPWYQYVESEKESQNTINDFLKDTEVMTTGYNLDGFVHSVRVGERFDLEDKYKKRTRHEEVMQEETEFEPKFKKRKEMTIPKEFFNTLTRQIGSDYMFYNTTRDINFAPSANAILQQEMERVCIELFKLTSELCKFFMTDLCLENFIPLAFKVYCGTVGLHDCDEESIGNHLSFLSMKELSSEDISSLFEEINQQNRYFSIDYDTNDDPDFEIEFEDPMDRVLFGDEEQIESKENKQIEQPEDGGYESDWSDESEIGIEIFESYDEIFYPSSIDQIESERPLREGTLMDGEYSIKYEQILVDGDYGFYIYSKDIHLVKRLLGNGVGVDQDLASDIGYELFNI